MSQNRQIIVHKAAGDWQYFAPNKIEKYLKHIGVSDKDADFVVEQLLKTLGKEVHTREIAALVTAVLLELPDGKRYSASYNIKEALRKLGPEGHNFEVYVGKLFEKQGFDVQIGQIIEGECVTHEVDVIATKDNDQYLIECKFHNREGTRSDVVVAMYSHSRFNDIRANTKNKKLHQQGWLATNTKLTVDALKYVRCKNMNLLSVENPAGQSIMDRLKKDQIFPVTSSTHLDAYLPVLLERKYILLEDILGISLDESLELGIPANVLLAAQEEAREVLH